MGCKGLKDRVLSQTAMLLFDWHATVNEYYPTLP